MRFNKNYYPIVIIFFIALVIRLAYAVKSNEMPSADAVRYDALGLSLAQGKGYVDLNGKPCSFYPPFYPAFLSVVYLIFGHNYLAVRIIQSIIGSFSCVLIWLIAKTLINNKAGIIAGMVSVIYFPFIKSAELLSTELLFTFLLLLVTLFLVKAPKSLEGKKIAVLGVLLGIAVLTKATMLLYILFIVPMFFFWRGKRTFMYAFKKYVVMFIFFAMSILPWTIRNFIVYHKIVPIATQGGITLYSGYCPPGGIFGKLAGDEDPIAFEASKISCPAEQSNFLVKQTISFIRKNPAKIPVIELKKILYFWAPFDWEVVGGKWFNVIYVIMAPFFILRFFVVFREFKKFYSILLPIAYFQIVSLVFYGSPRFRLVIEPFLFIFSAAAILELYGLFSSKK